MSVLNVAVRFPSGASIRSRRKPRTTKRYFPNAPAAVRPSAATSAAAASDGHLHGVDAGVGARAGAVPLQASALRWSGGGSGGGVGGVGLRKRVPPRRVVHHMHSYSGGDGRTGVGNLEAGPSRSLNAVCSWRLSVTMY